MGCSKGSFRLSIAANITLTDEKNTVLLRLLDRESLSCSADRRRRTESGT
jgi:hypothetical protein